MVETHKQRTLLALGFLLALLALALFHQRQFVAVAQGGLHSNDFKHLWIGARLLHLGESPYDERLLFAMAAGHGLGGINPYVYLPFTGLALWPVARLPFADAAWLWFTLNHLFLLAAVGATALWATRGPRCWASGWLAALGLLVAAFTMPLTRQLTAGQLNCALALILVVILVAIERRWAWLAGLAIAFAALFKLSPGLFVLHLLWKRAWRPLAWTAAWLASLMGWSLWSVGLRIHLDFLPLLADMRLGHSTWAHHGMAYHCDPANQAMGSFLLHILAGACDTEPWWNLGPAAANALTALFALAVLAATVFATRSAWGPQVPPPDTWRAEWALVVIASLLVPSLMWDHYAVQLLPVWLVGLWSAAERCLPPSRPGREGEGGEGLGSGLSAGRFGVALLWVIAALLLAVPVRHWSPALARGPGLLVMSLRLWGVLLMFALALQWRLRLARSVRPQD